MDDEALKRRLDAFVRGECDATAFERELRNLCAATPDFSWEVVALLDQYFRRGKISAEFNRTVRVAIERSALALQCGDFEEPAAALGVPTPTLPIPTGGPVRMDAAAMRAKIARYHRRIAQLSAYGRRTRRALNQLRFDQEIIRSCSILLDDPASATALPVGIGSSLVVGPSSRNERQVMGARKQSPFTRPGLRLVQAMVTVGLLLSVNASEALRELRHSATLTSAAIPVASATPLPPAPARLALSSERYVVFPGATKASFRVQRSGATDGDVSFVWSTRQSGAKRGTDFLAATSKRVHIPQGAETFEWSLPILQNPLRQHTELFYVVIGQPSAGASIGTTRQAVVVIMPP